MLSEGGETCLLISSEPCEVVGGGRRSKQGFTSHTHQTRVCDDYSHTCTLGRGETAYLVQFLPQVEERGELGCPGLSVELPLDISSPGHHLQLRDDAGADGSLAGALNVRRKTEEGGAVCLWERADNRLVVLCEHERERESVCVCVCACVCVHVCVCGVFIH